MNRLTAIRTFARPGFSPVKGRVRIEDRHFYRVTLQNIERDGLTDYMGLGEGEYTLLVPGRDARSKRDAALNHCNGVERYDGPIWSVTGSRFNHEPTPYDTTFHETERDADAKVAEWRKEQAKHVGRLLAEVERANARIRAGAVGVLARHPLASQDTIERNMRMAQQTASECAKQAANQVPWEVATKRIR